MPNAALPQTAGPDETPGLPGSLPLTPAQGQTEASSDSPSGPRARQKRSGDRRVARSGAGRINQPNSRSRNSSRSKRQRSAKTNYSVIEFVSTDINDNSESLFVEPWKAGAIDGEQSKAPARDSTIADDYASIRELSSRLRPALDLDFDLDSYDISDPLEYEDIFEPIAPSASGQPGVFDPSMPNEAVIGAAQDAGAEDAGADAWGTAEDILTDDLSPEDIDSLVADLLGGAPIRYKPRVEEGLASRPRKRASAPAGPRPSGTTQRFEPRDPLDKPSPMGIFEDLKDIDVIEEDIVDDDRLEVRNATVEPPARRIPRGLGAGWSEYYTRQGSSSQSDRWLYDIDEDWSDYDIAYDAGLDEEEDELPPILIWPLVLTAFAILIVLTGVLTLSIRTTQVRLETLAQQRQEEAEATLTEAVVYIQEADVVVVAMDKALASQVSPDSIPELEDLLVQATNTLQTLDTAVIKAREAKEMFDDPADQQIAQYAIDDAVYKKQMLLYGIQIISADIVAIESSVEFEIAWDAILAADTLMREAVSSVTTGGSSQISRSHELNQEALAKLDEANAALQRASEIFPEADFSTLFAYLEAKRESCQLAISSDEALLDNQYDRANSLNDQFREKDAEVVALALLIPDDPSSLIIKAYDEKTSDWRNEYKVLYDMAVDMDAYLREWRSNNVSH